MSLPCLFILTAQIFLMKAGMLHLTHILAWVLWASWEKMSPVSRDYHDQGWEMGQALPPARSVSQSSCAALISHPDGVVISLAQHLLTPGCNVAEPREAEPPPGERPCPAVVAAG